MIGMILSAIAGAIIGMAVTGLITTNVMAEEIERRMAAERKAEKLEEECRNMIKEIGRQIRISEEVKGNASMDL